MARFSRWRRHLIGVALALALAGLPVIGVKALTLPWVYDDFTSATISPALWAPFMFGGPVVAAANQKLQVELPASSAGSVFGAGVVSTCRLRGDFDIQVDYALPFWPFASGTRLDFSINSGGFVVDVERVSLGSSTADFPGQPREIYASDFGPGDVEGIAPTLDLAGRLRLTRTGGSVGAFFQSFAGWVLVHAGPGPLGEVSWTLGAHSHNYTFAHQDVQVAFGSVVINQGTLVCPDTTPPATTAKALPPPNAAGWNNSPVTVTLSASDEPGGSGVRSITYSAVGAQTIASTTVTGLVAAVTVFLQGTTTLNYFATDNAGNAEGVKTQAVRIDTVPPRISGSRSPEANSFGWNNTAVTVSFSCVDTLSGVASVSSPTTLSTEGANQSVAGSCTDNAGNTSTAMVGGINIDKTPPVITFLGNARVYTVDQLVTIICSAFDALSGVLSSTCPSIAAPAYTFPVGTTIKLNGSATDLAGNTGRGSTQFTVNVTAASLSSLTARFVSSPGVASALNAKLKAAAAAAERGNAAVKAGAIRAYQNQLRAQSGKSISADDADLLIRLSQSL